MGCGTTKSISSANIIQLRPFPVGISYSDSRTKLPNEVIEGFGNILSIYGTPYKPNNNLRKKPGKFEPGTNVYSNVIKASDNQPHKLPNRQKGNSHYRPKHGYNLRF